MAVAERVAGVGNGEEAILGAVEGDGGGFPLADGVGGDRLGLFEIEQLSYAGIVVRPDRAEGDGHGVVLSG